MSTHTPAPPSLQEAQALVEQVQIAHRLSVGWYQRLLPMLERIATELDLSFKYWKPLENSLPPKGNVSPVHKSAWDGLPLHNFFLHYEQLASGGGAAQVGDRALYFVVLTDDNLLSQQRTALGVSGEPDPLTLPIGAAQLRLEFFYACKRSTKPFVTLLDALPWPDPDRPGWYAMSPHLQGRNLTLALAEFISQPPEVHVARIRACFEEVERLDSE